MIKASVNGLIGRGVRSSRIDSRGHLIFEMTDGNEIDLGKVSGTGSGTGDMHSFVYDQDEGARQVAFKDQLHTHPNKAKLDTYTQTEANLADAVAKKHTHGNKAVLDKITSDAWDDVQNKQRRIDSLGILIGKGGGNVQAAVVGVDYQAPLSWDGKPVVDSRNPVLSGGLYDTFAPVEAVFSMSGWSGTSPYTQTVICPRAKAAWNGHLMPPLTERGTSIATDEALQKGLQDMCSSNYLITMNDGSIKWRTRVKPEIDMPIYLFYKL